MESTPFSRKLEQSGRLMIPVKLREQVGLVPGKEYSFFTHEENGRKFICIDCGVPESQVSLEEAMKVIQANGLKIVQSDD